MYIYNALICALFLFIPYFAESGFVGERCDNVYGLTATRFCSQSFCCGSVSYRYCCRDCTKRYPKPNCNAMGDETSLSNTVYTMKITWIVIGAILAVKGIAALIYFFCCRRKTRRQQQSRSTARIGGNVSNEPGTNTYPPYVSPQVQVDAPPSYDDLVKDGVLNVAYEHPQCGDTVPDNTPGTSGGTESDLPPPPPYYPPPNESSVHQPTPQPQTVPSSNTPGASDQQ